MDASGFCAEGFEPVREAFLEPFRKGLEVGGAVCVLRHGEPIVDLWAGHSDAARSRPWERDTLAMPYSVSKAMVAFCAIVLADRFSISTRRWPPPGPSSRRRGRAV